MREDLHGDANGHRIDAPTLLSMAVPSIRLATLDDVPAWIERSKGKYPDKAVERSRKWVEWTITDPDHLVLVGENSAGIAEVSRHYGFEVKSRLAVLFGDPSWETLRLLQMMLDWARTKGAASFRMDADTGVDFEPFAKRLGGRTFTFKRHEIPL